jgi:transposase
VIRAKALLMASQGAANTATAQALSVSPASVANWRARFVADGLAKLGQVHKGRGRKTRRKLEEARKQDIDARKFRNHVRDMLFVFKGSPSTSPYCTWVDDPREPAELPKDWVPADPPF